MTKIAIRLTLAIVASTALFAQTGCGLIGLRRGCSCCQPTCCASKDLSPQAKETTKDFEAVPQEVTSEIRSAEVGDTGIAEATAPELDDANLDF